MVNKPTKIRSIKKIVKEFVQELENNGIKVKKAFLFGSYARGKATKYSDIDVAIISWDFSGDRFRDMKKLIPYELKCDYRLEVIPFHPKDFVDENPLVFEIKRNGIRII